MQPDVVNVDLLWNSEYSVIIIWFLFSPVAFANAMRTRSVTLLVLFGLNLKKLDKTGSERRRQPELQLRK
jgi:hypothetical protein